MTDDQRERLNRFLAERVMGWKLITESDVVCGTETLWVDADEKIRYVELNWDPAKRLACCEPLLDKIERDKWYWSWDNADDGGYGCHAWNHDDYGYGWSKASRTEALCLAIARCYGWKEEP